MALTSAQQNDLFKLTVGLFNAAPGSFYTEVEGILVGSQTPAAAAQVLINTAAFQAILPSNILTNTQFSTKFLDMLVGSTVSDANKAWAVAQMDAKLNNGETQGAVAWWAIDELSKVPTSNADWGTAAATLTNKLDVAKYFTVDKYVASNSVATLQGLLVDVTSDVATVAVAKANATSNAIALTTGVGETVGTSGADTFQAFLANGANTLQSGDLIRGGAGSDTLMADISTQGTGENAIAFSSQSVEKVMLRAQHSVTTNNNGDNNLGADEVAVDAERATGVNVWENYNSRADLIVEDVRIGASQITKDITIVMRETDPGHVDYGVYFDQNSLRNVSSSTSQLNLEVLDTRSAAAGTAPLLNSPYGGFRFTSTNNATGVSSVITLQSQAINDAQTYAQLRDAFQAAADAQFGAGVVTASIGANFNANDTLTGTQVSGQVISLSTTGSFSFTTPTGSGWIAADVVPANSGLHTNFGTGGSTATALVTSTIVLDDVGRGSTGGDLVVGGLSTGATSTSKGVQRFEITVEDNSKLQTINSTNNTLQEVTIVNGTTTRLPDAYTTTVTNAGNLTVNGTQDNAGLTGSGVAAGTAGFTDVRLIDGSAMTGKLAFTANFTDSSIAKYVNLVDTATNPAADNIAVQYKGGTNDDTLVVNIDGSTAASRSKIVSGREDFTFSVDGGNGNDAITVKVVNGALVGGAENWYYNQNLNHNITVTGGAGNDTIRTPGAGDLVINAGSGDDTLYTDNTGAQAAGGLSTANAVTVVDKAAWLFNTAGQTDVVATATANRDLDDLRSDSNESYNLYKATLVVTFKGLPSATITLANATTYKTTDLEINQAIKQAINTNSVLNKLLVAKDGPANSLIVESLIDGALSAADLTVALTAPTTALSTTELAAVNAAWGTAYTTGAELTAMTTVVTNFNTKADYVDVLATDGTLTERTGAASTSTSDNVITAGEGNDVIVLGTTVGASLADSSNEVVTYSGTFGDDTIVNFAATGNGIDHIDFTSYLGGAAVGVVGAVSTTNRNVVVLAETTANDTAAEIKALYDAQDQAVTGTTVKQVYVAYNAHNVGAVYEVVDAGADNDTVVTKVGSIDLADTAWSTLTLSNVTVPTIYAEGPAATGVSLVAVNGGGAQVLTGTAFGDVLNGSAAQTAGDTLTITGNAGNDTITGGGFADTISGDDGADTINGGAGADTITSGEGADNITGGAGNDTITIGADVDNAADVVVINSALNADADTINGFAVGEDDLSFNVAGLALNAADYAAGAVTVINAAAAAALGAGAWNNHIVVDTAAAIGALTIGAGSATGAVLAIASDTGAISYDADGAFGAGAIVIGTVTGGGAFTAADLVLG